MCVLKMEELSNAVGSNYLIVKNILKYVSWREAEVAEVVCRLWQEVVRELKKTELHEQSFRVTYLSGWQKNYPTTSIVTSPGCFRIPELLITFQREFVENLYFKCPLNSCTTLVDESGVCSYCTNNELFKYAHSFCSTDTKVIGLVCPAILYFPPQERNGLVNYMGGLVIPNIPGVQVNLLNITNEECSDPSKFYRELNEIMDKNIIKCFLIFARTDEYNEEEEKFVVKMIDDTRTKQKSTYQFAVCGCITHESIEYPTLTNSGENITKVVVFSVNKSDIDSVEYSAYSSVFPSLPSFLSYSKSKSSELNNFKDQMKKISDEIPRRKYGICLKMAAGGELSDNSSGINDIVAEHFPNMPIVICESTYEFGVDCLPNFSNETSDIQEARQDMYENCCQFDSSIVILVMSWGPLL